MKEFLDRIKDQTKNFLEEVKEKNKGNRTELMLMGGFVLAFLALSVPEVAKEASSNQVQTDSDQEESAEAVAGESSHEDGNDAAPLDADGQKEGLSNGQNGKDTAAQNGSGESQTDSGSGDAGSQSENAEADGTDRKAGADENSGSDGTGEGNDLSQGETAGETDSLSSENSSSQNGQSGKDDTDSSDNQSGDKAKSDDETASEDETASGTEAESGNEAQETETDTEAAGLNPEALDKEWKRLQAQYGETFLFPMAAAAAKPDGLPLPELKYAMQLRGYDAVVQWRPEKTLQNLKQQLEDQIAGYDGEWSVYCKNLTTEESFVIHDSPMKSASVMKLFIMGTVYTAFENGELSRTDEIVELLHNMIVYSDNSASNELLAKLGNGNYADGIAKVDAFIASHGFSSMTIEYNGFNDPATNTSTDHFNQVAAKDCGKLLEDIYRRTWVNRTVSNEMESLLLSQDTRYKIPAGLPEGVLCGNKTGEMDTTENDAAIIYGKDCDYILVVLSSDWGSKDQAISRIAELSRITYQYLNPETDTAE